MPGAEQFEWVSLPLWPGQMAGRYRVTIQVPSFAGHSGSPLKRDQITIIERARANVGTDFQAEARPLRLSLGASLPLVELANRYVWRPWKHSTELAPLRLTNLAPSSTPQFIGLLEMFPVIRRIEPKTTTTPSSRLGLTRLVGAMCCRVPRPQDSPGGSTSVPFPPEKY